MAMNKRPIDRIIRPFEEFAHTQTSGGILLLICTVIALIWANSRFAHQYMELWETHLSIGIGTFHLDKPFHYWINDGLMVIFFFVVGLEIKRELLEGELASPRKAALPMMAALGGMVVPAALYMLWNAGSEGSRGWGIPMATDIAFALGLLALLGNRVPLSLKIFLTALAIVDDMGAILVIAIFYTENISWISLAIAGGFLSVMIDHGLLIDQNGRVVWRVPGMTTDKQNRVFMIGDWWTIPGDLGTLQYKYNGGNEVYEQLPRGEFFAVANVAKDPAASTVPQY